MRRRHALVVGLAGLTAACARTSTAPATPLATAAPTASVSATATPVRDNQVGLDVRLWNGEAEVQIDGRTIQPGHLSVPRGKHQLAALVDGEVAALADAPPDGGAVDLVVPPPHAGLAIMIENQADALPQSGLTNADVVYEALAEGGIT